MKLSNTLTAKVGVLGFANILDYVGRLITLMVFSRYFLLYQYGAYRQYLMVLSLATIFVKLGIPKSLNYFLPLSSKNEKKIYTLQSHIFLLMLGLILAMILFLLSGKISDVFNNPLLKDLLKIGAFVPIFALPTSIYKNFFIAMGDAYKAAKISIFLVLLRMLVVFIVLLLKMSLIEFFFAHLFNSFIMFVLVTYFILKRLNFNLKEWDISNWTSKYFRKQLSFSAPIGLSSIIGIINKQIDKVIISTAFDPKVYAIYSNGAFELPFIRMFLNPLVSVLMPKLVKLKENKENFVALWHKSIIETGQILIPVIIFTIIFAKDIIILLFSDKYEQSWVVFTIYTTILFSRVTNYGMVLMSLGETNYIFKVALASVIFNTLLNITFLKFLKIGILGPAIATVTVTYFMNYIQLLKIKETLEVSIKNIFPWKNLLRILVRSLLYSTPFIIIKLITVRFIDNKGRVEVFFCP